MLTIIEDRPDRDAIKQEVDLNQLPATIGRGQKATYRMALGVDRRTTYFRALSRYHATIYRNDGDLWIKDGAQAPSENGIYVGGRRIQNPVRLYPGAEVELVPGIEGYRLFVICPPNGDSDDFPTIGFEKEILQQELTVSDQKIEELTWTVSELQKKLNGTVKAAQTLNLKVNAVTVELKKQRQANDRQDRRLRFLKRLLLGVALVTAAATWLLLGGNTETLDLIGKGIISIISLVGAIASLNSDVAR
ncbi:MAG: FHA domain-containing protein [Cyanobacteria bacterium P01_D01_bin.14]